MLILLLWIKALFLKKKCWYQQIKVVLVLKVILSETEYVCIKRKT